MGIAGIVAAVGVVVAVLAWLLPQSPGQGTSSSTQNQGSAQSNLGPSTSVGAPTSSAPPATPTPSKVSNDIVKIVDISDRPGVADVTVRVSGPPSAETRYLLVIQHNGGYQYKGKVASEIGEHVVEADLRLAAPGKWRDFYVVGADAGAAAEWEATVPKSIIEMPKGTRKLTGPEPHQMPE